MEGGGKRWSRERAECILSLSIHDLSLHKQNRPKKNYVKTQTGMIIQRSATVMCTRSTNKNLFILQKKINSMSAFFFSAY